VGTVTEAEHVNLGSSPIWVVTLIHLGEWLPQGLLRARAYHLAHHARPDARFNIFLPLWDTLLGPAGN